MKPIEQRIQKLEVKDSQLIGAAKGRVECDEEGCVAQVFFKTRSGGERPATAEELKNTQVRWEAMTKFLDEHGIGAVDLLYDEKLKAECMKVMQEAGNREAQK